MSKLQYRGERGGFYFDLKVPKGIQGALEKSGYSASTLSRSRENSRRWSEPRDLSITRFAAANTLDIVGVPRARRQVEGKEKRRKRGRRRRRREERVSYASGGPARGPACKLCSLRKMSGQRARPGMNIIQLVIRGRTSLSPSTVGPTSLMGPASHTPYGPCGLCEARVTGVPLFQFCAQ